MDAFAKQALEAHNKARAQHNVLPLKWSKDLEISCLSWAKRMAEQGGLRHAPGLNGVGENIYMTSKGDGNIAADATKSWYSEVEKYDFNRGRYQRGTGHFTQVVWKSSVELGMARAKSANGNVYVVARYSPGGNDLNQYSDNILPLVAKNPLKIFDDMNDTQAAEDAACEEIQPPPKVEQLEKQNSLLEIFERNNNLKVFLEKKEREQAKVINLTDCEITDLVEFHNKYRSLHGAPPVTWSKEIASVAQDFAKELAQKGKMFHASKDKRKYQGENICRMSDHYQLVDAVSLWYSEVNKYDFSTPGFSMEHGHFTQLVWRKTREIGIGCARSENGDGLTYVVARYWPPGNILPKFEENVSALL